MLNNIIWKTRNPEDVLDETEMKRGKKFLVTLSNKQIYTAIRRPYCPNWVEVQTGEELEYDPNIWGWNVDSTDWHDNNKVIAWAELPAPYEGE